MFLGEPFKCSVCLQGTALPLLPAHPQLPSKPIESVLFLSALYVPYFSATSVSGFCLALLLGQKQEVVPLTQVWLCASWSYVLPLPGEWGPRACQLAKHMASRAVSFVGMCCRNAAFWDISGLLEVTETDKRVLERQTPGQCNHKSLLPSETISRYP